jgi:hypothetical protein
MQKKPARKMRVVTAAPETGAAPIRPTKRAAIR